MANKTFLNKKNNGDAMAFKSLENMLKKGSTHEIGSLMSLNPCTTNERMSLMKTFEQFMILFPDTAFSHSRLFHKVRAVSLVFILFFSFSPIGNSYAQLHSGRYDIVYIWNDSLDSINDYKEEVERLLGPVVKKRLRVVGRDGLYGLIYDRDGSMESSAQVADAHSKILVKAGLEEVEIIKDERYYELFNVSYGLGPNLEALKQQYSVIYKLLGAEAGNKFFIEKTNSGNYSLIYRRRGDRQSTMDVARRHAKLLRKKGFSATIIRENNNEVVHGESSFLDVEQERSAEPAVDVPAEEEPPAKAAEPVIEIVVAEKMELPPEKEMAPEKEVIPEETTVVELDSENMKVARWRTGHSDLEQRLEGYIKNLRQQGMIASDEKTAWLVYDFTSGTNLVDINVASSFQAASMIKPFVALAFFHLAKEGKLPYGPKSRREMEKMIQRSNNQSTNWVMKQAGGPAAVQNILKKYYGGIFKTTSIVEYIPRNGQTYRNSAAPEDYGRFLKALWVQQLPYGKEIRRLMALPGSDRLYRGTPIPRGTLVYNKTGSTAHLCGDMGILVPKGRDGRRYPYTIVGIIEKKNKAANYGRWKMARGNVIRKVSSMIYDDMKERYRLQ